MAMDCLYCKNFKRKTLSPFCDKKKGEFFQKVKQLSKTTPSKQLRKKFPFEKKISV